MLPSLARRSGQHVEDYQEAREEAAGGGGGDNGNAQDQRRKKDETVDQYMFYAHSGNSHTEVPMFVVGYEELYAEPEEGKETTEVVGVRIWKFVRSMPLLKPTHPPQTTLHHRSSLAMTSPPSHLRRRFSTAFTRTRTS